MDRSEEKSLIEGALRGEQKSYEALFLSSKDKAFSICIKLLGNREDALDAMQNGYIKAFRSLSGFKMEAGFDTWLYRIMINSSNDILRKRRDTILFSELENEGEKSENPLEKLAAEEEGPEEQVERKELCGHIEACLSSIAEEYRKILILRDSEGFSYEDIAEMLDIPIGTVKSRISRARQEFRSIYNSTEQK